jgi:hypothetical protein
MQIEGPGTGRQQRRAHGRAPIWPAAVAALTCIGLLVGLQQVVQQGVLQGSLRRAAAASHEDAVWRCNMLRGKRPRDDCLLLLPRTHGQAAAPSYASIGRVAAPALAMSDFRHAPPPLD